MGVLVLKLPDGETILPVFSFQEEAGMFPWREAEGELADRGGPFGRPHRAAACPAAEERWSLAKFSLRVSQTNLVVSAALATLAASA
jgi:hypothetical protein